MTINIVLDRLAPGIDAETTPNEDGSYTIMLDDSLCREKALKELLHELHHIEGNDFNTNIQANLLECMIRKSNFIEENLGDFNFYYHVNS